MHQKSWKTSSSLAVSITNGSWCWTANDAGTKFIYWQFCGQHISV